jgi:hypothetical protein
MEAAYNVKTVFMVMIVNQFVLQIVRIRNAIGKREIALNVRKGNTEAHVHNHVRIASLQMTLITVIQMVNAKNAKMGFTMVYIVTARIVNLPVRVIAMKQVVKRKAVIA